MLTWCFLATLLGASPIDAAREHLTAGQLDEVLFDFEGQTVPPKDVPKAAEVLADAAAAAYDKKDLALALQFVQRSLKFDANRERALEVGARVALAQQEFGAAEGYADRWIRQAPRSGPARLLRAQLAFEAGEWAVVVDQLDQATLSGTDAEAGKTLRTKAQKELTERKVALSTVAALERQLAQAAIEARKGTLKAPQGGAAVTLYGTSWCGYCKKAKAYLKKKGVEFVERDVEKEPAAAQELAQKAAAAGVQARGVPVIDVRGTLILGFDEQALESAL